MDRIPKAPAPCGIWFTKTACCGKELQLHNNQGNQKNDEKNQDSNFRPNDSKMLRLANSVMPAKTGAFPLSRKDFPGLLRIYKELLIPAQLERFALTFFIVHDPGQLFNTPEPEKMCHNVTIWNI